MMPNYTDSAVCLQKLYVHIARLFPLGFSISTENPLVCTDHAFVPGIWSGYHLMFYDFIYPGASYCTKMPYIFRVKKVLRI